MKMKEKNLHALNIIWESSSSLIEQKPRAIFFANRSLSNLVEGLSQLRPGGDHSERNSGGERFAANQDVRDQPQMLIRPHCPSPVRKRQDLLQDNHDPLSSTCQGRPGPRQQ